ncbi:MAG: hypothetical protein JW763_02480 [candidate division Zixibacteria bacterium]|nr:hypothetical protein [candidate division Zixibacteria bacterium]
MNQASPAGTYRLPGPRVLIALLCLLFTSGMANATEPYSGWLKIYVVEPASRWQDASLVNFDFGFLDFARDELVVLDPQQSYTDTITWDGAEAGYGDVTVDNIMVIAVLFNTDPNQGYSHPPDGYPFDAHFVDAVAAATPDSQWANTATAGFTHTVFIEEAVTTSCGYCPRTRNALHEIDSMYAYPFFYAAMVVSDNEKASRRMYDDYNLAFLPTCYGDGGLANVYFGYVELDPYLEMIETAGARVVPDLELSVSLTWLGGGELSIIATITNNEIDNEAPSTPTQPGGVSIGLVNTIYHFTTISVDPEGGYLHFRWDWGDGSQSDWLGPFESDKDCEATHQWISAGNFEVRVQARDEYLEESGWSDPHAVSIAAYVCGDASGDQSVNLLDILFLISYLYGNPPGEAPVPIECGDANADGSVNLLDILCLISFIYGSPPGPAPQCP